MRKYIKKIDIQIVLIILLLISLILGIIKTSSFSNKLTISTVLLNPKYLNDIKLIQIQNQDKKLILIKKQNSWYINEDNTELIKADDVKVNDIIKHFTKVIKVYKIKDSKSSNKYDNCILFYTSSDIFYTDSYLNSSIVSSIYFYPSKNTNYSYFSTGKTTKYQTTETYSDYFNLSDISIFYCKTFFPVFKYSISDIQKLTISKNNFITSLFPSDYNFYDKLSSIFLLSSSDIILDNNIKDSILKDKLTILKLTVETGDLSSYSIDLIQKDNNCYIYANNILYKISSWTKDKLLNIVE